MSKFDNVESVKAKYEAGERVFTSHEVMVLLTRISFLENAAQHRVQATCGTCGSKEFHDYKTCLQCGTRA